MSKPGFETMRTAMIDSQLRTSGVSDARLLAAFASVPREMFVDKSLTGVAYVDAPVSVGHGRSMMEPLTLGRLLEAALPGADESVLIVGGATGYSAAIIATLAARVTMVEEDAALADKARGTLATLGVDNVVIVEAPHTGGALDGAPYDLLLLDGAVAVIPDSLLAQVRDGGRIAAVQMANGVGSAMTGVKTSGGFGYETFAEVVATPLPGFGRETTFVF